VNLQETPDDGICDLRIFAKTDIVHERMAINLGISIFPIPVWRPRDALKISDIPNDVNSYYIKKAKKLELVTQMREEEKHAREQEQEQTRKDKSDEHAEGKGKEHASEEHVEKSGDYPELLIGNTHKKKSSTSDENSHHWELYVQPVDPSVNLDDHVTKIMFKLHPTFTQQKVVIVKAPYKISRIGWGTFTVGVKVYWKDGTKSNFKHTLNFTKEKTEGTVKVE